jgi:hemerythrin
MAIQWTDDLATGVQAIDDQHKELFTRVNLLFNACNMGKGRMEIGRTIAFLEDYVNEHFSTEERHMIRHQYPEYGAHKAQHMFFRNNLAKIKQQLAEEGTGIHIVILTNQLIIDWLRGHIRMLDRAFGDYLQNWT